MHAEIFRYYRKLDNIVVGTIYFNVVIHKDDVEKPKSKN
jgi:hypothetical protein